MILKIKNKGYINETKKLPIKINSVAFVKIFFASYSFFDKNMIITSPIPKVAIGENSDTVDTRVSTVPYSPVLRTCV